jgi:hypothetical protein
VAAAFAEVPVGRARDPCLGFADRLDDDGGLEVARRRKAADRGSVDRDGAGPRLRLVAQDGDESRAVDDHRGKPRSS